MIRLKQALIVALGLAAAAVYAGYVLAGERVVV
ncbi:MAG: hypothetical protein QOF52_2155, partial [Propionibacteriaceae bacterium]|nr:hypothetical protein [Propionibacteriaceae bacterium]